MKWNAGRGVMWVLVMAIAVAAQAAPKKAEPSKAPPAQPAGDPYQQLLTIDFGEGEDAMASITQQVMDAKPDQYPEIEKKLLAVLEAKDTKLPGRQFACRMLKLVGSTKCIPAIAGCLADEKLSHMARQVLQGMTDASAGQALVDALGKTSGKTRIGIINTIGDRREPQTVAVIAKFLDDKDEATVLAAIRAIGRIAAKESNEALKQAKVSEALKPEVYEARLLCGQGMEKSGQAAEAHTVYSELYESGNPSRIRAAALSGLVRVDQEKALSNVIDAFKSEDALMRQGAVAASIELRQPSVTEAIAKELPNLSPASKVAAINALAGRGMKESATGAVNAMTKDADAAVRVAAIIALRPLGDATSVGPLVESLSSCKEEATQTLKALFADGVGDELIKRTESAEAPVKATLIGVLADRKETKSLPLVTRCVSDSDKAVRQAALKALGSVGTQAELDALITRLSECKDNGERDAIDQGIAGIAKKNDDVEKRSAPVIAAMGKADADTQVHLINILNMLGGKNALDAVRAGIKSPSADVKKAAIRAMKEWPDDSPLEDLKAIAADQSDKTNQVLALQGFIRLIGLRKDRPADKAIAFYKEAMSLATRPEEKRSVLGGLSNVKNVESLKMITGCFKNENVKNEAFNAALKVAPAIADKNAAEAKAALEQVLTSSADQQTKDKAKSELEKIKK